MEIVHHNRSVYCVQKQVIDISAVHEPSMEALAGSVVYVMGGFTSIGCLAWSTGGDVKL